MAVALDTRSGKICGLALLNDEIDIGKATIRNCINGTVGFEQLALDMDMNAISLEVRVAQ